MILYDFPAPPLHLTMVVLVRAVVVVANFDLLFRLKPRPGFTVDIFTEISELYIMFGAIGCRCCRVESLMLDVLITDSVVERRFTADTELDHPTDSLGKIVHII